MDDVTDNYAPLMPEERARHSDTGSPAHEEAELVFLSSAEAPQPPRTNPNWGSPTATWVYLDATSAVLQIMYRFDPPGERKQFSPCTLRRIGTDLRWRWKALPAPRPLYGLDRLAANPGGTVVVCEGEKATDAAQAIFPDFVAVTSSGGSGSAAQTDWDPLRGRRVVILPDNDDPGMKYASTVAAMLATRNCKIELVDVAALVRTDGGNRGPDRETVGWDAADAEREWLDHEALRAEVLRLAMPLDPGPTYVSHGAFQMRADGLWLLKSRTGKHAGDVAESVEARVSAPFEVLGRSRNSSGGEWGLWLRWRDADNRGHHRLVQSAALHGDPASLSQSLVRVHGEPRSARDRAMSN